MRRIGLAQCWHHPVFRKLVCSGREVLLCGYFDAFDGIEVNIRVTLVGCPGLIRNVVEVTVAPHDGPFSTGGECKDSGIIAFVCVRVGAVPRFSVGQHFATAGGFEVEPAGSQHNVHSIDYPEVARQGCSIAADFRPVRKNEGRVPTEVPIVPTFFFVHMWVTPNSRDLFALKVIDDHFSVLHLHGVAHGRLDDA